MGKSKNLSLSKSKIPTMKIEHYFFIIVNIFHLFSSEDSLGHENLNF